MRYVRLSVLAALGGGSLLAAPAGSASPAIFHAPIAVWSQRQSSNWSGYNQGSLEQGHELFTSVSGTWVVPTATQHTSREQEYSSTWIGIGGGCVNASCSIIDATLIQEGTEQDVAKDGSPSYNAWWELIPAPEVRISNFPVHAGDKMAGTITQLAPGLWKFTLSNKTTGRTFTKTVPYPSSRDTVEWITETPLIIGAGAGFAAMPNLGTVKMDLGLVNGSNPHLKPSETLQLAPSGHIVATPSAPDPDDDGFNDCVWATSCVAPGSS